MKTAEEILTRMDSSESKSSDIDKARVEYGQKQAAFDQACQEAETCADAIGKRRSLSSLVRRTAMLLDKLILTESRKENTKPEAVTTLVGATAPNSSGPSNDEN